MFKEVRAHETLRFRERVKQIGPAYSKRAVPTQKIVGMAHLAVLFPRSARLFRE
jgi:hypothetical protein